MQRVLAIVKGTVQGVGYRYFASKHARALGVVGYVMNLRDGDVKVVAECKPDVLDNFVELLKRGPSGAYVREVVAVKLPATGEFNDFKVRHE